METKDWFAWINTMPPPPDDFHVTGEVLVGNPGVEAQLTARQPQGINPNILMLDLHLIQRPGMWPQVMTWVQARYDKVPSTTKYQEVEIFHLGKTIATVKVSIVS